MALEPLSETTPLLEGLEGFEDFWAECEDAAPVTYPRQTLSLRPDALQQFAFDDDDDDAVELEATMSPEDVAFAHRVALPELVETNAEELPEPQAGGPVTCPPRRWECIVARGPGKMGMSVAVRRDFLTIHAISLGHHVDRFNKAHSNDAVEVGDRICKVNGMNEPRAMVAELAKKEVEEVTMIAERPGRRQWQVQLHRKEGKRMGVELLYNTGEKKLAIQDVKDGSILAEHNDALPDLRVRQGDFLIAINGVTDPFPPEYKPQKGADLRELEAQLYKGPMVRSLAQAKSGGPLVLSMERPLMRPGLAREFA